MPHVSKSVPPAAKAALILRLLRHDWKSCPSQKSPSVESFRSLLGVWGLQLADDENVGEHSCEQDDRGEFKT